MLFFLAFQLQRIQVEGSNPSLDPTSYMMSSHSRCDSAPIDPYTRIGSTTPPSPPTLRIKSPEIHKSLSKLHGSQHLLDPLVDFTPEQLNMVSPESHRMSVAW